MPTAGPLSSPDGAITLMVSDIADADTAAARMGDERWEQLLRDHHMLVERLLVQHEGELVKTERDGFLAFFNSAHSGLYAALDLQRTFSGATGDGALALRIGLHSGFLIAGSDRPLGRNVVLAARIAARAGPGEILVSSTLKQYTETDPSFEFDQRGEYHFKGLLGEHQIYGVRART